MPVVLGMRWWQSDERRLQEERRGVKRKKKSPFFNSLLETVPLLSVPSRVAQSYWPIITTSQFPACCSLASFRFWLPLGFFCSRCFFPTISLSPLFFLFFFSHQPANTLPSTTTNKQQTTYIQWKQTHHQNAQRTFARSQTTSSAHSPE